MPEVTMQKKMEAVARCKRTCDALKKEAPLIEGVLNAFPEDIAKADQLYARLSPEAKRFLVFVGFAELEPQDGKELRLQAEELENKAKDLRTRAQQKLARV